MAGQENAIAAEKARAESEVEHIDAARAWLARVGAECLAESHKIAPDGLIDAEELLHIKIGAQRKHKGKALQAVTVNALEATDEEFLAYVYEKLCAGYAGRRLGFRMLLLWVLRKAR